MKKFTLAAAVAFLASFFVVSCNKSELAVESNADIPAEVLGQISRLGFSTHDVLRDGDTYIVEGDIVLHEEDLHRHPSSPRLIVAEEEQYHTFNLVSVTSAPRTITISMKTGTKGKVLPPSYTAALDEAIARYNAENLTIRFQRVSSNGNIDIVKGTGSYLASAGFPSGGNPYGQVKVNSSYLGNNPNTNYLATILAHEIGHCIGFRHTDYMNRAYSCGGSPTNEGQATSGVGAVHIPGTPTGPDPNSWMLACIGSGQNRPFNANDRQALDYLY